MPMASRSSTAFSDGVLLEPVDLVHGKGVRSTETRKSGVAKVIKSIDPFGDEDDVEVMYRVMTWWKAGMLMIAETISLGILSLPTALPILGLIPGLITIIALGILSTYTGSVIGQLKQRYIHIHSMADAGEILLGRYGALLIFPLQLICLVFIMGSHIVTFSIMMNVLTDHGACTILFGMTGFILSLFLTLPRRLEDLSYLSVVGFVTIVGAVLTTMIGVPIPYHIHLIELFPPMPSFVQAFLAISYIMFAYAGHVAFFTIFSELRDIRDSPKSLALLQATDIALYTIAAIGIYFYAGSNVASPTLNSGSHIVRKTAYGLAMPTIVIGGVVNGHVAAKSIYVRLFRGRDALHEKTLVSRGAWAMICGVLWAISWVIAEDNPTFGDLIVQVGSGFASWFTFGLSGFFWFHLNEGRWFDNKKKTSLFFLNSLNVIIGLSMFVICLYVSFNQISREITTHGRGKGFSCADNSGISSH